MRRRPTPLPPSALPQMHWLRFLLPVGVAAAAGAPALPAQTPTLLALVVSSGFGRAGLPS